MLLLPQTGPVREFLIKQQLKPDITSDSVVERDAARCLPSLLKGSDVPPLSLGTAQPLHVAHVWKVLESTNEQGERQE